MRILNAKLLTTLLLMLGAQQLLAATTYEVGTCKAGLPTYSTISAAVAAAPAGATIDVCPGTYYEQVVITQALTLQGISSGLSGQAVIMPPSSGLVANATDSYGSIFAAQVYVNNASGPVSITDITVNGAGNSITSSSTYITGIFYENSSGTLNRDAVLFQAGNGVGYAVFLDGGASNPSVTVENCSIGAFDKAGILTQTNASTSELTAAIKNNNLDVIPNSATFGISIGGGTTSTVTNNAVTGPSFGISVGPSNNPSGSISNNLLVNNNTGIYSGASGVSVTSNRILGGTYGIVLTTSTASIESNTIDGSTMAIEFQCQTNPNVHSNTITDVRIGVDGVPSGVGSNNTYSDVPTVQTACQQ